MMTTALSTSAFVTLAVVAALASGQPSGEPALRLAATTPSTAGAGIPLPSLRAVVSPRGVVLMGEVPDGLERDLIVRRARQIYGAGRVTDLLRVREVGNPAWLSADFLPDLRDATEATAVLENATLVVEGQVRSREAQARLVAALADVRARGVAVELRLSVGEGAR